MPSTPVIRDYVQNVRGFNPDIRLFLIYNLFANIGFGVFQLVFNLYLLKLGLHEDDIGAFSAAQTICMGIGGLALGYLINRYGSWKCVVGGFAVFLAAETAISFAETRAVLFILSALYGFGLTFLFNTTMPFLLEWGERKNRAHAAAISFSLISLSVMIGSLAGGLFPDFFGALLSHGDDTSIAAYRWTLVVGTMIAGLGLIPLFMMQNARSRRGMVVESTVADPTTPSERRQVRRDMGVFIFVGGFMALGVGMVIPFFNVYLTTLGANTVVVGLVFAVSSAVAAVFGLAAPAISRRFGSIDAVMYLRASIVPVYLLLLIHPVLGIAMFAFLARQAAFSVAWPIEATFIGELLPPKARASVFGLRGAAWNFVSALAAFVGGKIIVRTGYEIPFVSICVFTALSAILFAMYYRRHPLIKAGAIPSALPHRRIRAGEVAASGTVSGESPESTAGMAT